VDHLRTGCYGFFEGKNKVGNYVQRNNTALFAHPSTIISKTTRFAEKSYKVRMKGVLILFYDFYDAREAQEPMQAFTYDVRYFRPILTKLERIKEYYKTPQHPVS
jgi:hypothetical protein